jgi:hypothetical protein
LERRRDQTRPGFRDCGPITATSPACRWRHHAGQFLQGAAAERSRRHRRLSSHRQAGPQRSSRAGLQGGGGRDPYPDAEAGFNKATFADPVKRGAYLATIGHCMECHSAWPRGVSDFTTGLGRGGRPFPPRGGTPEGTPPSIAPNITAHPTAGIGAWTDPEIGRAITLGTSRDGRALKPPMASAFA